VKTAERAAARRLRAEAGWSIKQIAAELGVSPASVSRWVGDVPLRPDQEAALLLRDPVRGGRAVGRRRRAERARELRREAQEHGRRLAREPTPLFVLGCALYWAEGSKGRNQLSFSNSDPDMLRLFLRFLQECHGIEAEDVRLNVHCHLGNGLSVDDIERYWLTTLELPIACLRTTHVVAPSPAESKRGKPPYGTVRLRVSSTRVTQAIFGAIQELGGFDRAAWLD
jgi:AcrR family transcriptional regulator